MKQGSLGDMVIRRFGDKDAEVVVATLQSSTFNFPPSVCIGWSDNPAMDIERARRLLSSLTDAIEYAERLSDQQPADGEGGES